MADRPEPEAALRVLRSAAQRARLATRLAGDPETALLQSIVDATITLFDAEAASIAIFERDPDRLEFRVAAGEQGAGAIGLSVPPSRGIAGFVVGKVQRPGEAAFDIRQARLELDRLRGRQRANLDGRMLARASFALPGLERARITGRFRSYVDPSLVDYVVENPDKEQELLHGAVRELTVVFSDLAGYTTISERLGRAVVPFLKEYFDVVVPIIRTRTRR